MQQEAMVRERPSGKPAAQFRQGSALRQLWDTNLEVFQRDRMALFGLIVFAIFALVAIFAPYFAERPLTPLKTNRAMIKDALLLLPNRRGPAEATQILPWLAPPYRRDIYPH